MSKLISVYPPDSNKDGPEPKPIGVIVARFRSTAGIDTGQHGNIGSSTPARIVGGNPLRRVITIRNEGAVDIYLGNDGVTITTGFRIGIGQLLTLETGGDVYGITPSGTGVVHWLAEIEES